MNVFRILSTVLGPTIIALALWFAMKKPLSAEERRTLFKIISVTIVGVIAIHSIPNIFGLLSTMF